MLRQLLITLSGTREIAIDSFPAGTQGAVAQELEDLERLHKLLIMLTKNIIILLPAVRIVSN